MKSAAWGSLALVALDVTVVLLVPCEDLLPARVPASSEADVIAILFHGFNSRDDGVDAETERRLHHGIRLYRLGRSKNILVSGGNRAFRNLKGSRYMARFAAEQRVPDERIVTEDQSWDSFTNLQGIFSIMRKNGWQSVHLVSSPCHLARIAHAITPESAAQIKWAPYPAASASPPAGPLDRLISANYNLAAYLIDRLLPRTLYRAAVRWLRDR